MKKIALYSILCALMLSALLVGCNHGKKDSDSPVVKSPLVGVWEITNMDDFKFPGDCLKDPENLNSGFVPQAQPYYYLADNGKAYWAIKTKNVNEEKLSVRKTPFDYKIEGDKINIGSLEFTFKIDGNNVELKGIAGRPVIKAKKVENPTGAQIISADPIQ